MRIAVDFPAPLLPRSPNTSPSPTARSRASTATKTPNRFVSWTAWIASDALTEDDVSKVDGYAATSKFLEHGWIVADLRRNLFPDLIGGRPSNDPEVRGLREDATIIEENACLHFRQPE